MPELYAWPMTLASLNSKAMLHPYANAIRILEFETNVAQKSYELLREGCQNDKEQAGKAQEKYDLAVELRHAANVLRNSKPSGILD